MANTDKNIVITPNIGQTAEPKIVFTGSGNTPITMRVLDSNALSFEGSVGQLFSITNSLTGSLFAVNDISGIPSIEVLDTGLVKLNQYNGQTVIGSSAAVQSSSVSAMLSLVTRSATTPGLIVKGFTSQSANLQEWQNSAGSIVASVNPSGNIRAIGQGVFGSWAGQNGTYLSVAGWNASDNVFVVRPASGGIGDLVQYQTNAGTVVGGRNVNSQIYSGTTAPLTTAIGGAITGAVGSGTAVTITTTSNHNLATGDRITIASVNPSGYNGTYIVASTPTATTYTYASTFTTAYVSGGTTSVDSQATIIARSAATAGLIVRGGGSGVGNYWLSVQDPSGSSSFNVNQYGNVSANVGMSVTGSMGAVSTTLSAVVNSASAIGLMVKGTTSQSGNLLSIQDVNATELVRVRPSGQIGVGTLITGVGLAVNANNFSTTTVTMLARAFPSQLSDIMMYQNSSSTAIGGANANAQLYTGSTAPLTAGSAGGATTAASGDGTTATITTTNNHGIAVGDRITVTGVTPTGYNATAIATAVTSNTVSYLNATTGAQTVAGTVQVDSQLSITTRSNATVGLNVNAPTGQAVDIARFAVNFGTVAKVSSAGNVQAVGFQTLPNSYLSLGEENSGSRITMVRQTAAATNPGANQAKLYFRDGTVSGTLKLVTRGGASGAETTILDNIDQSAAVAAPQFNTVPVATQGTWTGAVSLTQADTMGSYLRKQLTGNTTVTIASGVSGQAYNCTLELQQDATGSRTIILSGTRTAFGVAFTLSTAANAIDVIRLEWNGTFWTAYMAAQAIAVPTGW